MKFLCKNNKDHNKFESFGSSSTLMAWDREFDKEWNALNYNPNTISTTYRCLECNSTYLRQEKGLNIQFLSQDNYEVFHSYDKIRPILNEVYEK